VNHLGALERLANSYSVMRHGQSKANAGGIIVSRVENDASGDYGLTEPGREQVRAAALSCPLRSRFGLSCLPPAGSPPAEALIFSSDFARAAQTAEIMRVHLGVPDVVLATALRERCFGDWEGTPTANYRAVWAADEAGYADDGVEPVGSVLDRVTAFILDLEREHSGRDILLVSHGDTLQILQAGFARIDPARHRHLPHLETAEVRRLRLVPQ
jgi:glucosyl-3-phosphoglycerate phosphatase